MPDAEISLVLAGQVLIEQPVEVRSDPVAEFAQAATAAFCNLEVTVAAPGAWPTKTKTLHLAVPAALGSLAALGFRAVGHANNHAFDHGPPGVLATRAAAAANGIAITGSGADADEAGAAAMLTVGGHRIGFVAADCGPQPEIVYAAAGRAGINPLRLRQHLALPDAELGVLRNVLAAVGEDRRQEGRAAIGYRDGIAPGSLDFFGLAVARGEAIARIARPDPDDLRALLARLGEVRRQADLVVVSLHHHHWEAEWERTPAWFLEVAAALIDAGADAIVGTGTPVLQPVRFHRGKPILAGLGNLIFHTHRPRRYDDNGLDVWRSALCRCVFSGRGCARVEILPIAVGRPEPRDGVLHGPVPLTGEAARSVFDRLTAQLSGDDRRKCVRA